MKHIYRLIYIMLPLLLTSCIKEGFDKENCPGEYIILPLTPDSNSDQKTELEGDTTVIIDSEGNEHPVDAGSDKPIDLEDGTYTVVTVKDSDNGSTTVNGTTINVNTHPDDGTAVDAGTPIGGYTEITADIDNGGQGSTVFEVPTKNQSRPLTVILNFEGGNAAFIQSIAGIVDGIALSRDLNNGFAPTDGQDRHPALTAGSISYAFAGQEDAENSYSATRILLGIDGDGNQTLTFTVTYKGGTEKTYTFDITRKMDGFHTVDVNEPWVIEITLQLGADFEATIEDWKAGPESWMDAH